MTAIVFALYLRDAAGSTHVWNVERAQDGRDEGAAVFAIGCANACNDMNR